MTLEIMTRQFKGFIKIKKVVSSLYIPKKPKVAIIVAQGGPGTGDNLKSEYWQPCKNNGAILMVPDYIGHSRSEGSFNFTNCLETIKECEEFLLGKLTAIDGLTGKRIESPKIKKIVVLGSSWGGAIAPFVSRIKNTTISDIVLISPVTDWSTLGNGEFEEESPQMVHNLIKFIMSNLYRDYKKSEWDGIFFNSKIRTKFNPIENLDLLKDKNVFVFHGNKDKSIHWTRTEKYVKKLRSFGETKLLTWRLFLNLKHGGAMKTKSLEYYFKIVK